MGLTFNIFCEILGEILSEIYYKKGIMTLICIKIEYKLINKVIFIKEGVQCLKRMISILR